MPTVTDDLQYKNLVILRDTERFSYGHDAVLLANFVRAKAGERMIDLGTGTGIVAILAHAKTGVNVLAVDIDEACCELARRSVALNALEDRIEVMRADLRELAVAGLGAFDAAACNPPYFAGGTESLDPSRRRSMFQRDCTLSDAVCCAARLLKNGGRFFVCYPTNLLSPLCAALEGAKLSPKRIRLVKSKADKPPYLVLIEAKKSARPGAILEEVTLEGKNEP
ncbi:MAG TPA: methyltransferase [Clostridia bacterium]|nr:methyltransferase [Clostridia bacterium]